jgi:hypothetical protein
MKKKKTKNCKKYLLKKQYGDNSRIVKILIYQILQSGYFISYINRIGRIIVFRTYY